MSHTKINQTPKVYFFLKTSFLVCYGVLWCVCVHVHRHAGLREVCWLSFCLTLHLIPWDSLSLSLQLAVSARQTGQWAPGLCLFWAGGWGYRHVQHAWYLHRYWESESRSLSLYSKHSYSLTYMYLWLPFFLKRLWNVWVMPCFYSPLFEWKKKIPESICHIILCFFLLICTWQFPLLWLLRRSRNHFL